MRKKWSATFEGDIVIFVQGNNMLKVNSSRLPDDIIKDLRRRRPPCGGCMDLPIHGYQGSKSSWCNFSKCIANLYVHGIKWTNIEKPNKYMIVVNKVLLDKYRQNAEQSFYFIKCLPDKLQKKVKKIQEHVILEAPKEWPGDYPYYVGYVPDDIKDDLDRLVSLSGVSGDSFFVDDSHVCYTYSIRQIKNNMA